MDSKKKEGKTRITILRDSQVHGPSFNLQKKAPGRQPNEGKRKRANKTNC